MSKEPKPKRYCLDCNTLVQDWGLSYRPHGTHHIIVLDEWRPEEHRKLSEKFPRNADIEGLRFAPIPPTIDFRPVYFGAGLLIKDQGNQGSCTAQAWSEAVALAAVRLNYTPIPPMGFSAQFGYKVERDLHNWDCRDTGAYGSDPGTAQAKWGICLDKDMPYDPTQCYEPSAAQFQLASQWKSSTQAPVTPDDWQLALELCSEQPALEGLIIAVPVAQSFMQSNTNGGWIPDPGSTETLLGGHMMLVIGKKDDMVWPNGKKGAFILIQSWGPNVADHGVCYMSYTYANTQWCLNNGGCFGYQIKSAFTGPTPPPPSPGTTEHTYQTAGNYNVTVTVTDSTGNIGKANTPIEVTAEPPVFVTLTASPDHGQAPLKVTLTATPTTGTPPYTYSWDYGD
jgi:hypothetical protein